MIDYLIALFLLKVIRESTWDEGVKAFDKEEPYAGLFIEDEPPRRRPELKLVK